MSVFETEGLICIIGSLPLYSAPPTECDATRLYAFTAINRLSRSSAGANGTCSRNSYIKIWVYNICIFFGERCRSIY